MKEYIERGWLLELYTMGGDESAVQNYHVPVPMILETINAAPAADVVEVRHGRWIEKKRWSMGKWHKWLECSKCGHVDYDLDMYEDMPFTGPGNYCPNCGAKMDKEE